MRRVGFGFCKESERVSRTAIVQLQSAPFCGQSAELASYGYDASDGGSVFFRFRFL
jgi:hypothetical protein